LATTPIRAIGGPSSRLVKGQPKQYKDQPNKITSVFGWHALKQNLTSEKCQVLLFSRRALSPVGKYVLFWGGILMFFHRIFPF